MSEKNEVPLDETIWEFYDPDPHHTDCLLIDGRVWTCFRDGRKPELSGFTVEHLRKMSHFFTEIPPKKTS